MTLAKLRQHADILWTLCTARTPVYVILYLTSRCNFSCPMCFYLDEITDPNKEEIAIPGIEKISRSLGRMIQLSLTGGEPFLRKDIPQIVGIFAKNNGIRMVTIPTNGAMTDRIASTVEQLVADYPEISFRIAVSLDGYPQDHDRIRAAGSFAKIERTLAKLYRIRRRVDNLVLDINTCYSTVNENKLVGFADFVADRFDVDNHTVTYVRGNADEQTKNASASGYVRFVGALRRRRTPREFRPFSSLVRAVTDYQRDIIHATLRQDRMYVPCVAGKKMIVISERGDVLPCEILNRKMGSLKDHDYNVRELIKTPQAVGLVDWIRKTRCHCTFECALATSIIYDKASYPRLLWRAVKIRLGRRRRHRSGCPGEALPESASDLVQVGGPARSRGTDESPECGRSVDKPRVSVLGSQPCRTIPTDGSGMERTPS